MQEKISLQKLVALNSTTKSKKLIVDYGYKPARNYNDLISKLYRFTKDYREEALKELANIHPHKDLIMNYFCVSNSEPKSNAYGDNKTTDCQCLSCQLARMKMYANFDGNENTSKENLQSYIPMILIGGLVSLVFFGALNTIR
jgi:hypothetical protein